MIPGEKNEYVHAIIGYSPNERNCSWCLSCEEKRSCHFLQSMMRNSEDGEENIDGDNFKETHDT